MNAVQKNAQLDCAFFASGRCGVPPLVRVMEDSVNLMDSLPSVETDLTEAAIRGSLPPSSVDPIGSSSLQDDTFASLVLSRYSSTKCWSRSCPNKFGYDSRPTHLSYFLQILG